MSLSIQKLKNAIRWIKAEPPDQPKESLGLFYRAKQGLPVALRKTSRYLKTIGETKNLPDFHFQPTTFEAKLPLRKSAVWLYSSFGVFFLAAIYLMKGKEAYLRGIKTMQTLAEINIEFFKKYPSHFYFDRSKNKLGYLSPSDWLFRGIYYLDCGNNNLFPSLHVSTSSLVSLLLYNAGYKRSGKFMLLWSLLLSASILPAKQHYQADLVAGLVLASLVNKKIGSSTSGKIFKDADLLFKNLLAGNYSPLPNEKTDLISQVDPLILDTMKRIEELNPFDPIYSEVIQDSYQLMGKL